MEIKLANSAGFCFGVKRAVDRVYEQIERGKKIYTFGPIIHNETVVADLEKHGVEVIDSIDALRTLSDGAVVIRSHGVPKEIYDILDEQGLECIDATCPFVKKIHRIVEKESNEESQIVIIGNDVHPEVEGIKGWCKTPAIVVESKEEAQNLSLPANRKVCVVSQTTFNYNKFQELVEIISKKGYDINVVNTICNATEERQTEAAKIASDFQIEVRTDKDEDGKADTGDDAKQLIYSGKLSGWNVATKLKQGYYVVTASYGSNAVGFNSPVFKGGPVQFTIVGGETTTVKIPVVLENAIVRIEFTDMFKKYYSFDKLTLTQGGSTIDFSPTETRGAFVEATAFTLSGTFTAQSGAEKSFRKEYQARMTTCHRIEFDASNIGGNTIDITFDDEPSETIKFDAELNEQPSGN